MAGKKFGANSKSEEARAKKNEVKKNENERKIKEKEDKLWEETDEKIITKQKKLKEKEDKKMEELKKKKEARELLKKEEEENRAKYGKPTDTKVTRFEINQQREKEQRERERVAAANADPRLVVPKTTTTTTTSSEHNSDEEDTFDLEENMNHILREQRLKEGGNAIEARDINDAIGALSIDKGADQHPERRMKAAFAAYEEVNLPILRKENPSLRLTQVKQLLWKEWLKSPENPITQAKLQQQQQL
ncbi:hypothetical protein DICPUDRAFT_93446 [Dictyostelium purpureum]|uniref:Coiled-coil domain-containing protein n=1 Tax=Dictyostelium purpureum TaxID=5786 RepID=F0Z7J4_DICPU|nr:uncharacterized protein DICPUDRAFT_93446 [Dictyostelium purpureum]EGC40070.1 hypothetical protein DICPUDRAFT_93446 [Dictyostelium purpureum]|eukprot:XP_003283419.1 hypothetical protein DICPUDRAFT_93446 [Dictyostelium purpureum]